MLVRELVHELDLARVALRPRPGEEVLAACLLDDLPTGSTCSCPSIDRRQHVWRPWDGGLDLLISDRLDVSPALRSTAARTSGARGMEVSTF
ncbi:MAG TPA: hypothetical protein VHE35_25445 [Kofleriaceae bacterium]|nr:hypothetical protein [Kofleriaceae bacterium]